MAEGPRPPGPPGGVPIEGEIIPPEPRRGRRRRVPQPADDTPPSGGVRPSPPPRRLPSLLPSIDAFDGVWRKP